MAALDLGSFPFSSSRVPDAETQAKSFLTKYPEADGRGVVIAVMDTGCDPGAPGLQVTSHGLPKIIDCVDCTGSGDVDTSTVVEAIDGLIQSSFTGRSLKLGSGKAWTNPTGKWHVGMKRAYELYDEGLVQRVSRERKAALDEDHRGYLAEARRALADFEKANPKPEGDASQKQKDLDKRISELASLQKAFEDPGIILDVIAWHDGEVWRAAVGGREDGDMSGSPALAVFSAERQWASLGELEQMNYCVNVYDEGSLVSIVCDISSHGTHVAGICAACHPDEPERNGVAPGAQVVSLKIGDTRLDGMETGTGLARGFVHCIRAKVDLINLSFGEGSSPATVGRVIEIAQRTVSQHGITFVTSAGNNGPGLETISAPADGSDNFLVVGAHVSPAAMEAQYSLLEKVPSTPFTWTSRGPTQDGSLGVTLCAPGSAITSVPNWTLAGAGLKNGTSMSAPNACGCVALVLSALKAAGVSFSPASILRAVKVSALPLPSADPFAVGAGMIQVESCYDYMLAQRDLPYRDVSIDARVAGRGRGIYLREPNLTSAPKVFQVVVDPCWRERDPSLNKAKIDFNLNVAIVSSVAWVKVPPYVVLPSSGRGFNVHVDPTGLQPGEAHLGYVTGFDTARPDAGPLFRVPVTVIRPVTPICCPQLQEPAKLNLTSICCMPGTLKRTFVEVPNGCTWAEITVTAKAFEGSGRLFFLHVLQDLPHMPPSKSRKKIILEFPVAGVQKNTFRVEAPGTLEVTLAQFWSNLGKTDVDLEISLHGITPEVTSLSLTSDDPIRCVHVVSGPGAVTVKPSASLTTHRMCFRPKSASIEPGGERDLYPEGKLVHDLVLEYALKMEEDGEVTPQALVFNDRLYENVFEGQLLLIFDSCKRLVTCSDAWPDPVKLKKGEYVARLQIRHDDVSLLERLKALPFAIDRKLDKAVSLKAFSSFNDAVTASGGFGERKVKGGTRLPLFFAMGLDEKLPDAVKPGDVLLGTVSYGEPTFSAKGKFSRGGFTVVYTVSVPNAQDKKEEEKSDDPRSSAEKLAAAILDTQVKHLESLRKWATRDAHEEFFKTLLESNPKHLPLRIEQLVALEDIVNPDAKQAQQDEPTRLQSLVEAVDEALATIDLNGLAAHLGRRIDKENKEAVRAGKEWDKTRDFVVLALTKKVVALAKLSKLGKGDADKIIVACKALGEWVDLTEAKYARVTMLREQVAGRLGLAIAALNKQIAEEKVPKRDLLEERVDLLQQLGWKAWADQERLSLILKFPKLYSRF